MPIGQISDERMTDPKSDFPEWKKEQIARYVSLARSYWIKDRKLHIVFSTKRKSTARCIYCDHYTPFVRIIDERKVPTNRVCDNCVRLMYADPCEVWMKWRKFHSDTGCVSYIIPDTEVMSELEMDSVSSVLEEFAPLGDPLEPLDDDDTTDWDFRTYVTLGGSRPDSENDFDPLN